jgi:hypothetical protein
VPDAADSKNQQMPPARSAGAASQPGAQPPAQPPGAPGGSYAPPRHVRIGAIVAVIAVAAFLVWYFAIRDGGGDDDATPSVGSGPVAATRADLVDFSKDLDQPIYWAGEQPGTTDIELTQTQDGNVYVRYLSRDAAVANTKPSFLTIGTYPFPDAYHALKVIGDRPGGEVQRIEDDGLVVTNSNSPTSVYLAYPGKDIQVEVYDPNPSKALDLVTSGAVAPVR